MKKSMYKRKPVKNSDLFHTPFSCTWKLLEHETFNNPLDPCCGDLAIVEASKIKLFTFSDITTGKDFLKRKIWRGDILTNFPFSRWDDMVIHAKKITAGKVCTIGRGNYLGTYRRGKIGVWQGLSKIYFFNRYVDFQTPYREDGLFHVGGMLTGWFIWEKNFTEDPVIKILDVHSWAKLGSFKK